MRVLYLSAWFPYPPDNGARLRSYYLMRALASHHEVHLISLLQNDSDPANAAYLSDVCNVVSLHPSRWFKPGTLRSTVGLFSSKPRSIVDTFDRRVWESVREAAKSLKPDLIVASSLGVAHYVPHNMGIHTLLDEHNCEYAILKRGNAGCKTFHRRVMSDLSWKKAARWEATLCRAFDAISIVSERDKSLLLEAGPDLDNIHIVPNGVDTDHYSPADRKPEMGTLIYNGALTYGANRDAVNDYAREIYPLLRGSTPNVVLSVTGNTAGVDLSGISDCPGVRLTGYLDDIRTELYRSSVCVVPLRQGGGSRLKILEAMAAGVPVVSTTVGAEGIDIINGTHAVLADTPREFADAVARVMNDSNLANALSVNGRRLVDERYSWNSIGGRFVQIAEHIFD